MGISKNCRRLTLILVPFCAATKANQYQLSLTWADAVSEINPPLQNCRPRLIRASNLCNLNDTRFGVEAGIVLLVLSW
jgi:hypothetical protein